MVWSNSIEIIFIWTEYFWREFSWMEMKDPSLQIFSLLFIFYFRVEVLATEVGLDNHITGPKCYPF